MKIISFDIGIKNMAYCIFDLTGEELKISSWDVINLIETVDNNKKCNQYVKKTGCICNKMASFFKDDNYYCKVHTKQSGYETLEKDVKVPENITKKKIIDLMNELKLSFRVDSTRSKREELRNELRRCIKERYLSKINKIKKRVCTEYDLIEIGKKIKIEFDKIEEMNDLTHVIIENQISPIASRMKTIQGMVAQYFIMKYEEINIDFISSSNKLKLFNTMGNEYKQHKKDAIYYCQEVLKNNNNLLSHKENFLKSKKKDDMADSFLQGIWYIKNKSNKKMDIKI